MQVFCFLCVAQKYKIETFQIIFLLRIFALLYVNKKKYLEIFSKKYYSKLIPYLCNSKLFQNLDTSKRNDT